MSAALQTTALCKRFGGLMAISDVSLRVEHGARHALIGPNGAGKTTLINLLTGLLAPDSGLVLLDGLDIRGLRPDQRVKRGLVRTFQVNQLFPAFTPLQAVALAVARHLGHATRFWQPLERDTAVRAAALDLLERFDLTGVMSERTSTLSYGKQRLLEIAVAIACGPRVLLLDEPAAGVPELERAEILAGIAALPADVTVLLIEHDMDLVFRFADCITVMALGAVLMEGTPSDVARDARVREVYLGDPVDG